MYFYDDHWMTSVCQADSDIQFYDGSDLRGGVSRPDGRGGWDNIKNMIHEDCPIISNSPYMIHLRAGGTPYTGPPREGDEDNESNSTTQDMP